MNRGTEIQRRSLRASNLLYAGDSSRMICYSHHRKWFTKAAAAAAYTPYSHAREWHHYIHITAVIFLLYQQHHYSILCGRPWVRDCRWIILETKRDLAYNVDQFKFTF